MLRWRQFPTAAPSATPKASSMVDRGQGNRRAQHLLVCAGARGATARAFRHRPQLQHRISCLLMSQVGRRDSQPRDSQPCWVVSRGKIQKKPCACTLKGKPLKDAKPTGGREASPEREEGSYLVRSYVHMKTRTQVRHKIWIRPKQSSEVQGPFLCSIACTLLTVF